MEGKIIKNLSDDYVISTPLKEYTCKPRGKFRKDKITPLVGDNVIFNEKELIIEEILERNNSLIRPPVSNIDKAFIITSVKNPDFSPNLLDKLLTIISYHNIEPIICLTKIDLLNQIESDKINNFINYYNKIGYKVYKNTEISEIKNELKNSISIFTGQSGAGKSTLLNHLDKKLELKTNEISYALGRGKHTTRCTELFSICDGLVADTPGFSSISFPMYEMDKLAIRDNFIEFNEYKDSCKYRDCMHLKEDNCGIKNNIGENILESRYENYKKFIEELK